MKCLFDEEKECPLTGQIPLVQMGRFCQACITREELKKTLESMQVMKAQLILAMLRMFPKDEEKAKQEYRKMMQRVKEW